MYFMYVSIFKKQNKELSKENDKNYYIVCHMCVIYHESHNTTHRYMWTYHKKWQKSDITTSTCITVFALLLPHLKLKFRKAMLYTQININSISIVLF